LRTKSVINQTQAYYQLCNYYSSFGGWGSEGLNLRVTSYARMLAADVTTGRLTLEAAKEKIRRA
jgi:hypothetical protein